MTQTIGDIRIVRAAPGEARTAYGIVAEYYEALRVVARETPDEFRQEYFAPASGVWLAWSGPDLAGCIALRQLPGGGAAEIKRMYVRDAYRGLGIAEKLLREAETFAKDHGYREIFLDTTDEMQAAVRLYERNGWKRCARYNANPQATIFMSKRLR